MKNVISNEKISFVSDSFNVEPWALSFNGDGVNYLWHSPEGEALGAAVCFPLLGFVPDNKYTLDGKEYVMNMHGFAQTRDFNIRERSTSRIVYELTDDEATYAQYPWRFSFQVIYSLEDTSLKTEYRVQNRDSREMFFSVGGHPRFSCPIGDAGINAGKFEDYVLVFNKPEGIKNIVKSYEPLEVISEFFSPDGSRISLDYRMFTRGCFCFHPLNSDSVTLQSGKTSRSTTLTLPGITHFQLWTAPGAEYIALEPWYGSISSLPGKDTERDRDWKGRPGTLHIAPGEEYLRAYYITIAK